MDEVYQEFGTDARLSIKLCVVDCSKEMSLLQQYSQPSHTLPFMYFMFHGNLCDKLMGIVDETQVKEGIDTFIDFAIEQAMNENKQINGVKKAQNASFSGDGKGKENVACNNKD
uniref:Nitrogenase molybdenum-iron protein alpha chain n=1 Tax=Lygus hesperus TaxID=30085 RepID=A0A0A9X107_LYGHE